MTGHWKRAALAAVGLATALACASPRAGGERRAEAERETDGQRAAAEGGYGTQDEAEEAAAASQARAQEQAPSTRATEGAGGKNPHPLPSGREGDRTFAGDPSAPPAGQQGRVEERGPAGQGGSTGDRVEGRVASVDAQARELVVDQGSATRQVKVAPDAQVTIDGERASFGDIQQGSEIRATMEQQAGADEPAATRLEVTRPQR